MAAKHKHYRTQDHEVISSDGVNPLFVRTFHKGEPERHFIIVHGAVEHSGRHSELAEFWLKNYSNVMVTVFDLIGHGRSGGPRAFVPSFKNYVQDLLIVGKFTQSLLTQNSKTFICAHSLGGLITLSCFLDTEYGWPHQISGLLFSSPCVKAIETLGSLSVPVVNHLNRLLPHMHLPMHYRGINLTRDRERAVDFDTDSLIPKFITVRMARELLEGTRRLRGLSYYMNVPSYFMIAGDDVIVDSESSILFAHGIAKDKVDIDVYPECRHELWNELNRTDIFKKMKLWADLTLKETP